MDRRVVQLRGPGASLYGKPNFKRVFGGQFVVSKGGGQTQNAKGNSLRKFEKCLVGRNGNVFGAVQTMPDTLDLACFGEIPKMRAGDGEAFELLRAHKGPFLDDGFDMFRLLGHEAIISKPIHL